MLSLTVYVGGKVKLLVRNVTRTLLPSRHYKFLLSPCISFARNTRCVQYKEKQLCNTDYTGSYFIKPNKGSYYT